MKHGSFLPRSCSLSFAVLLGLTALAACGSDDDTNNNNNNGPQPICTTPTEVACADQVLTDLFGYNTTAPGLVTNTADGDNWLSEIDATAGAVGGNPTPNESFIYAAFTDQGLVKLDLSDEAAISDMNWDMAFRRYVIRVNSGDSGPSCTSATPLPSSVDFDSVLTLPPDLTYYQDDFETATCTYVQDGAGLGAPAVVMGPFYKTYMGTMATIIQMTDRVFVVELKNGHHLKLVVTHYYAQNQDVADTDPGSFTMISGNSGHVGIRWTFLD